VCVLTQSHTPRFSFFVVADFFSTYNFDGVHGFSSPPESSWRLPSPSSFWSCGFLPPWAPSLVCLRSGSCIAFTTDLHCLPVLPSHRAVPSLECPSPRPVCLLGILGLRTHSPNPRRLASVTPPFFSFPLTPAQNTAIRCPLLFFSVRAPLFFAEWAYL